MNPIFVSDLHLRAEGDERRIAVFTRFIEALQGRCEQLFIVGDLFDFYIDFPDAPHFFPEYRPIFDALADLDRKGTRVVFFEGNHDFRLSSFFYHGLGIEVITEDNSVLLGGYQCYLAHGDQVNSTDTKYLALRRFLRGPIFSLLLRLAPRNWIPSLGKYFSDKSRTRPTAKTGEIEKLYRDFARSKWEEGYDVVILGHNHRRDQFEAIVGGRRRQYFNLGQWTDSSLPYLELTPQGFVFGDAGVALRVGGELAPVNVRPLVRKTGSSSQS